MKYRWSGLCIAAYKLLCPKVEVSDLKIVAWPQHQRSFGYIPGIELQAGSSFYFYIF